MAKRFWKVVAMGAVCATVAFGAAACEDEQKPAAGAGVSEEKWEAMLAEENFENYTLTQSGYVVYEGADIDGGIQQDAVVKFADDKVQLIMELDGELATEIVYTGEEATLQRSTYTQVFMALLDAYESYTYDAASDVYKVNEKVTVELTVYDMPVVIVMEEGQVKLSDDGRIVDFTCDYTQTTNGILMTTEMHWTFSDYGTTVIDEESTAE